MAIDMVIAADTMTALAVATSKFIFLYYLHIRICIQ